jgi:hypothetical protein
MTIRSIWLGGNPPATATWLDERNQHRKPCVIGPLKLWALMSSPFAHHW